jgi:DNA-binding transcriptional regulator YiaG
VLLIVRRNGHEWYVSKSAALHCCCANVHVYVKREMTMANLDRLIKDEIKRLVARDVRRVAAEARKVAAALKRRVRALEQDVDALKGQNRTLQAVARKTTDFEAEKIAAKADEIRVGGKSIGALRLRLGLSREEFGRLLGVSAQSVYLWERKAGRLRLKPATKARVFQLRSMGKRAARAMLDR